MSVPIMKWIHALCIRWINKEYYYDAINTSNVLASFWLADAFSQETATAEEKEACRTLIMVQLKGSITDAQKDLFAYGSGSYLMKKTKKTAPVFNYRTEKIIMDGTMILKSKPVKNIIYRSINQAVDSGRK